jgi:hypothetical protein
MKKFIIIMLALFVFSTSLFGCSKSDHKCENKYYLIKESTCGEDGVLETICSVCGAKTNVALEKNDIHDFEWEDDSDCFDENVDKGYCRICGVEIIKEKEHVFLNDECVDCGALKHYDLKESQIPVGYSLQELVSLLSTKFICYEDFETVFSKIATARINRIGLKDNALRGKFSYEGKQYNFSLDDVLEPVEVEEIYEKNIYTIEIKKIVSSSTYSLNIIYSDGTKVRIGYFGENVENNSPTNYIEKIGINTNKQVIVFYKDATYSACGALVDDLTTNGEFIVYEKKQAQYNVCGYLGTDINVKIPKKLLGVPIVAISKRAFINKNIQSVTIGENIENIHEEAFKGCASLTQVQINRKKFITIKDNVFLDTNVQEVFYYGDMQNIAIYRPGNEQFMGAKWTKVEN